MLTVAAPAKINVVLEVLGKRDDGFHEIRSIVRTINLCDSISLERTGDISLNCSEPALQTPDNLVLRAANLLKKHSGYEGGAAITLNKRIPWSAGLGGGSSDAAATLSGLNKLWNLQLQPPDLLELAAQLGSDVPLFIHQGTTFVEGRGEKITPLPAASSTQWSILLVPLASSGSALPEKTKKMYAQLNNRHFTQGQHTARALEQWYNIREIPASLLFNTFDFIVIDGFPELGVYWRHFEKAGAANIHVAGSGPTLFAPMDSEAQAAEISRRLISAGLTVYTVSTT